jgi:hypothetical protein
MSVTFSPATPESVSIAHNLTCACGDWVSSEVYPDYLSAYRAGRSGAVISGCVNDYCLEDRDCFIPAPAGYFPEVNLSNHNASMVLETLGVDVADDLCGSMSADDFLGRVLIALAISPADEGMPAYKLTGADYTGQGGLLGGLLAGLAEAEANDEPTATFWQGARPAGYLQERLEMLREIAEFAKSKGWGVCWG